MQAELRRLQLPTGGSKEELQTRLRGLGAEQLRDFRERTMAARAKKDTDEGAVSRLKQKMCEGCGLKRANYGLASEGKKRWCAGCHCKSKIYATEEEGVAEGAVRLDKQPRGTAAGKQGARSVRAREVFGGDDIDSDGDEAPRAEEEAEAAGEAEAEAAEEVKAEPAPALEPEIKREPSDGRRQQQQRQPTCMRSAKRRAVWVRGGAGGPRARVQAEEAASQA
jgi:hypothetical protein